MRFRLTALAVLLGLTGVVIGGLEGLSRKAEFSGEAYPFKWQDWLRYFVPSLWTDRERPGLMLTGPSTARENFLREEFAAAFPSFQVLPCALSLGTFRDVTAALEYVEKEYGRGALPEILVLGISPRFMAEIPRERPFELALARYGRHFGPLDSGATFGLTRKGRLEGTLDHLRFRVAHQSARYRTALAWAVTKVVSPEASRRLQQTPPVRLLAGPVWGGRLGLNLFVDAGGDLRRFALRFIAPYRYQPVTTSMPRAELARALDDPNSFWPAVFRWDPASNAAAIRGRTADFMAWTKERGIDLYIIRLPEHSLVRSRMMPGFEERFDAMIDSAFRRVPVLDLACLLPDEQFLDGEHALLSGAKRVTAEVIAFMNANRQAELPDGTDGTHTALTNWSRRTCAFDR